MNLEISLNSLSIKEQSEINPANTIQEKTKNLLEIFKEVFLHKRLNPLKYLKDSFPETTIFTEIDKLSLSKDITPEKIDLLFKICFLKIREIDSFNLRMMAYHHCLQLPCKAALQENTERWTLEFQNTKTNELRKIILTPLQKHYLFEKSSIFQEQIGKNPLRKIVFDEAKVPFETFMSSLRTATGTIQNWDQALKALLLAGSLDISHPAAEAFCLQSLNGLLKKICGNIFCVNLEEYRFALKLTSWNLREHNFPESLINALSSYLTQCHFRSLTNAFDEVLKGLESLNPSSLTLMHCTLTQEKIQELSSLSNLEELRLTCCAIPKAEALLKLNHLNTLHLEDCSLECTEPNVLTGLTNLKVLSIQEGLQNTSQSEFTLLQHFKFLKGLKILSFPRSVTLVKQELDSLKNYRKLQILDLTQCKLILASDVIERISWLTKLKVLSLGRGKIFPEHIEQLTKLKSLIDLSLNGCEMELQGHEELFSKFKHLMSLNLSESKGLTKGVFNNLAKIENLRALLLRDCGDLKVEFCQEILSYKNLWDLDLSGCRVPQESLEKIQGMPNLIRLELPMVPQKNGISMLKRKFDELEKRIDT